MYVIWSLVKPVAAAKGIALPLLAQDDEEPEGA